MTSQDDGKSIPTSKSGSPYRLNMEQEEVYLWLKKQELNVDDGTLNFWARKYRAQRLMDVVQFAHARRSEGQQIRNIGGWIHKLLKEDSAVVNNGCIYNSDYAKQYAKAHQWQNLHIYEKYVKDGITSDDLSLTMPQDEFKRALEALHRRSELYS